MNPTIEKLRSLNHHENPFIRAAFVHLTEDDWNAMTPEDELGKLLVQSYQQSMSADHERLCWEHHGRAAHYDGELGPATNELLEVARCGCPDWMSQQDILEATGRGSWPAGCDPEYPNHHVTTISFDMSGANENQKAWWKECFQIVQEAYREIGLLIREVQGNANHELDFRSLGGSTIGLAIVGQNLGCGKSIWLRIDKGYAPSMIRVAQVFAHELAHNMGIGHINGDPIQNPSVVNRDWNGSFKGTPLGNVLEKMFGGEPVPRLDEPEPPTPQPPTGEGKLAIRGVLDIQNFGSEPVVIGPGETYPMKFYVQRDKS